MRVLIATLEYPPGLSGGIGHFYRDLHDGLVRRGDEVSVVTPTNPSEPLRTRWELTRNVARKAREFYADVVETHDWAGPLLWRPGCPTIVRMHGAHSAHAQYRGQRPSRFWSRLERRTLGAADLLASVSRAIGELTLRACRIPRRNFEVIPNGIDTRLFSPQPVEKDPGEILYVGSIHERKGLVELFQAVQRVFVESSDARLTLVGRAVDPSFEPRLVAMLPSEMRARVRFLGLVPRRQLPYFYSRAGVVVAPSLSEAFGLTALESMSCGTPPIVSSLGGAAEVVEDGRSGLLIDPRREDELADALRLLLGDATLRTSMGYAARKRALERFEIGRVVEQTRALYQQAISQTCAAA